MEEFVNEPYPYAELAQLERRQAQLAEVGNNNDAPGQALANRPSEWPWGPHDPRNTAPNGPHARAPVGQVDDLPLRQAGQEPNPSPVRIIFGRLPPVRPPQAAANNQQPG